MNIEEERLQELLNQRKHHIKSRSYLIDSILSLVSFILTILLSGFLKCEPIIKVAIIVIAVIYLVLFFYSVYGSNYSVDALYRDVCSVSTVHNLSLIIIKNSRNEYLLKYNKRWNCYLFPFIRTKETDDKNNIADFCKQTLNLDSTVIKKTSDADITKRSVSADLIKTYHHKFYQIECSKSLEDKSSFSINNDKYKWYSIEEMKTDKNIFSKNSETISYVEKNF